MTFSFEHLEAIVGLFIGLISILCVSEERERDGDLVVGAVRTHSIYQLSSLAYGGVIRGAPKQFK